jgi:hypothetical protein
MGSWVSYGLGTYNQNLPSFVVIAPFLPYGGTQVYASDFLPACHQGTRVLPGDDPIASLRAPGATGKLQETEFSLVNALNRRHFSEREHDTALAARIKSYETAFHMQQAAPEAFDLSQEPAHIRALYGLDRNAKGPGSEFGWQCLVARRLAERGVRFIELIDTGSRPNWDSHGEDRKSSRSSPTRPSSRSPTSCRSCRRCRRGSRSPRSSRPRPPACRCCPRTVRRTRSRSSPARSTS